MKCPHCLVDYHPQVNRFPINSDAEGNHRVDQFICSACGKSSLFFQEMSKSAYGSNMLDDDFIEKTIMQLYPKGISRTPCSDDVPSKFSEDYKEACLVLVDSPKASAALSRRCLQNILRECANVKPQELAREIQEVIDKGQLPSSILESLDAVRNIGNYAVHPNKSTSTGEIVPVEPGEAEWCLDVLESLFDFYFVQPAIITRKKTSLNAKLLDMGRPPMK